MLRSMTNTYLALLLLITLFLLLLPLKANAEIQCQIGISSGTVEWRGDLLGDRPYTCVRTCKYLLTNVAVCFVDDGTCVGEFVSNGQHCLLDNGQIDPSDGLRFGGNRVVVDPSANPDTPWDPNAPPTMPNKVQNVLNQMPRDTSSGVDQAKALKSVAHIEGMGVISLDELVKINNQSLSVTKGFSSQMGSMTSAINAMRNLSDYIEKNTFQTAQQSQIASNTLANILNKLSDSGSGGGSGLPDSQFNSLMTSISTTRSMISSNANNIVSAVRDVREAVRPVEFGINQLNSNVSQLTENVGMMAEGLRNQMMEDTDKIVSALNSGGSGNGDLSGVQSGIDSIKTGIDNLNGLLSGNGLSKPGIGSGVDFGELPLYGEDAITKLNTEITDLQKEYSEKTKEFKKLFSFDITKLESGQYKDHSLTFKFANGATTKFTSGVFPALVDNAALISSVILFLAAFAGIKTIMGERE
ncbi:Phage protein [Vibrio cholerae]|nr:Phage protein [Vibrio cholerae]